MPSLRSSSLTEPSTPGHWQKPPAKTRTVAQKKVYGKRKIDAPRAVFDQGSPARVSERRNDELDDVRLRLAGIKIADGSISPENKKTASGDGSAEITATNNLDTQKAEQRDEKRQIESRSGLPKSEDEFDTPAEPETEDKDVEVLSFKSKPQPQHQRKRWARMIEVRICPKITTPASRKSQTDCDNTTESKKTSTRRRAPTQRLSSGCIQDEKATAYVRPILSEALSPIAAEGVQKFNSWANRASKFEVIKLAEGSYGEVYKLRLRKEACKEISKSKLARLKEYGDGVFKIVPLRPQRGPRSRMFTSVDEIVAEAKMLKYLDPIPGFARFRDIHVVRGRFPEAFQAAWDHYKDTKDDCLNPDPSSKSSYPDTQMWAIVEMDDAGCELEKFSWSSVFQIYDIFWGVAMALARAEEYSMFEHRDLHLGNVCIRSTRPDGRLDPPTEVELTRRPSSSGFGLSTLETTIIDYSLSRAEMQLSDDPSGACEVVSSDLDQKEIFDAVGQDEDEALLRDTYRHMRAEVYTGNPTVTEKTPDIDGIWAEYAPRTNLIWLLFLLKNLLKHRKPEPSTPGRRKPLSACSPNQNVSSKNKRNTKKDVKMLPKQIHANELKSHIAQLSKTLEERLQSVLELLDLEQGDENMRCAADLVAYAINSQWLEEKDFF